MVKLLARARNRTQFRNALKNDFPTLVETYDLMLRDLTEQPPELVKLATKTLKTILDASEPVEVTQLMSDLALEIAASVPEHGRNLTEAVIEVIVSSCQGFVSSGQLSTHGIHLHFIHQTAKEFLEEKYANESLAA